MSRVEQPRKVHRVERERAALDTSPFRSRISLGSTVTAKSIRKNRAATHLGLEMT
jgi:hypothetical protein